MKQTKATEMTSECRSNHIHQALRTVPRSSANPPSPIVLVNVRRPYLLALSLPHHEVSDTRMAPCSLGYPHIESLQRHSPPHKHPTGRNRCRDHVPAAIAFEVPSASQNHRTLPAGS